MNKQRKKIKYQYGHRPDYFSHRSGAHYLILASSLLFPVIKMMFRMGTN
jgi:hypothetical protein